MEATLAAVEQACRDFQNPATRQAAEQTLLQFRNAPQPIAACQYILEKSSSLEAKFHAAVTLREGMMRQWAVLSADDVRELRSYILRYVLHVSDMPAVTVVRSSLVAALAVLLKRSWMVEGQDAKVAFFQEVQNVVSTAGSASAQRTGVEILEGIVSEFALATASSLGLPWQYHEHCHMDLETNFLHSFFTHAGNLAKQAVSSGAVQSGEDAGTCTACMSLIAAILSWEFRTGFGASPLSAYNSRRSSDLLQVRLPPTWLELVMSEESIGWLLALLPTLRGKQVSSTMLARKARELMVLLCMVSSDSFPRMPQGVPYREAHLKQCLRGIMLWIYPAEAALQLAAHDNEEEVVDACRALASLTMTHKARMLDKVGGSHPVLDTLEKLEVEACRLFPSLSSTETARALHDKGGSQVLNTLDKLTCGCLAAGGITDAAEGTWVGNCTRMLLEAWLNLLQPEGSSREAAAQLPHSAVQAATHVFLAFMDASLKDFAAGAHEEAQNDDEEEAGEAAREALLSHAAALARCNPAVSFPAVREQMLQRKQMLYALTAQGADTSECLEQLCWLMGMAAACLADYCPGECTLMPETVLVAANTGHAGTIVELSHALLEVCALVLQDGAVNVLSPRLMEVLVNALARWIDTYLFSTDGDFPEALAAAFGPNAAGQAILEMAVRVATTCLLSYPGEAELHHEVCETLLTSLVCNTKICQHLVRMGTWQALTNMFSSRDSTLTQQLHQKRHRALAHNLCRAACGFESAQEKEEYIKHVMMNVPYEMMQVAQQPRLEDATRPDVIQKACCLLECLRGATLAASRDIHTPLFMVFSAVLPTLLVLHAACASVPLVVGLLLKLAADMVDTEVDYLEGTQVTQFLEWVYKLVQQYASTAARSATAQLASSQLQQEKLQEAARELRALMYLLTNLVQRDLVAKSFVIPAESAGYPANFVNGTVPQSTVESSEVVIQGLNCILPLMSQEMLKYPKLGKAYFTLLSNLAERYPHKVAGLPSDQFERLMMGVQFGVKCDDPSLAQLSLEALAGLGKWHFQQVRDGKPGMEVSQTAGSKGVAAYFMEVILQRLLLEDNPADLVDNAADALLPLLLSQPEAFEQLAASIVHSQKDAKIQQAVHAAISEMLQGNGLNQELTRQNKAMFRENLVSMVANVRGLLLTR